jgi:hypothetical protein
MMTKPWLHALCLHSYLLIPKLSNENKSRMRVEKREFAWEFSQLSSHDHANENKLSCMRVNESWEARVRLSVFSTLVPRSNENKSCMGVEKWAWEFHQLKREQELVVVWELRSESLHESLLNSIKASCMRVDESWEARVCMHACMHAWEFSQLIQTRTRVAWELLRSESLHESLLNSVKREQELYESCMRSESSSHESLLNSVKQEYTITLWFPCLDGLIQTRGNVARSKHGFRPIRARVIYMLFYNKSCMRVDESWEARVCMRVFSTLDRAPVQREQELPVHDCRILSHV